MSDGLKQKILDEIERLEREQNNVTGFSKACMECGALKLKWVLGLLDQAIQQIQGKEARFYQVKYVLLDEVLPILDGDKK